VRGVDFVILVTEPTPFGLHDLKQMLGILEDMRIRYGVVINREGIGNAELDRYLEQKGIPILMRIPFDKEIARGIAAGKPLVVIDPNYHEKFKDMYQKINQIIDKSDGRS
jgi:MinD superfamily P-loop ATPase